jgi:hypothetical protein
MAQASKKRLRSAAGLQRRRRLAPFGQQARQFLLRPAGQRREVGRWPGQGTQRAGEGGVGHGAVAGRLRTSA